jgi:hypothetical protein
MSLSTRIKNGGEGAVKRNSGDDAEEEEGNS